MAASHVKNAREALRVARPDLNDAAAQVVLAIAYFESGFGTIPMKNGFLFEDGSPSHNWGARKGSGDAGCIYHGDADENGAVCFSAFSSAVAGARGFFRTRAWSTEPFRARVLAAAARGDAYGVARGMYDGGYYTGFRCNGKVQDPVIARRTEADIDCAVTQYATAIHDTARRTIAPSLGQASLTHISKPAGAGTLVLVAGVGVAAVWAALRWYEGKEVLPWL